MRWTALAILAAGLAVTACGPAEAPARPAGGDDAAMRAWAEGQQLTRGGWAIAATEPKGVSLVRLRAEASAYPLIVYDRRTAFVEVQKIEGRDFRIAEARIEADCEARRIHLAGLLWRLDLQGRGDGLVDTNPTAEWRGVDPGAGEAELTAACQQARAAAATPAKLEAPAPTDRSPKGVDAWVDQNGLGLPDWSRVSGDPQMAVFLRAGATPPRVDTPVSFWAKTEFFDSITLGGRTFRSVLEVHEADCAKRQLRSLTAVFYPRSGLKGEGAGGGWRAGEWSAPNEKSHRGAMLEGVCAGVGR